jgi:1-acyl-sn-glycerol-3-phosphate acyltransferase
VENGRVGRRRRDGVTDDDPGAKILGTSAGKGAGMTQRGLAGELVGAAGDLVGAIPGVRLIGGVLSEKVAARTFFNRWLRRGVLASFGVAFSVPYFAILNDVHVEGDDVLPELPRRNVVFLANHQTYFLEAMSFFDLVYVRHQMPLEDPVLRFSAAEETMKKNLLTKLMTLAGGVTFRRSFREGGVDVKRPVDLQGVERVEEAIRDGWLLHFPAGTTKKGAPLRSGVSRLLHQTKAVALPVRVEGFRELLLHKQVPGKLFQSCSVRIYPPLDLADFYSRPYEKEAGLRVLQELESKIGDPPEEA